jgi:hypothetical protein
MEFQYMSRSIERKEEVRSDMLSILEYSRNWHGVKLFVAYHILFVKQCFVLSFG